MSDKQYVIIAPHCDDEIIGCYEILLDSNPIIIYYGDSPKERREEAQKLKEYINIKAQLFQKEIPTHIIKNCHIFAPDPFFEIHPLHRKLGFKAEQLLRDGYDVTFYNTIMNAPYIHEVENIKEKEELLNTVYPTQKDLWLYEKKYVLFEGRCTWHRK